MIEIICLFPMFILRACEGRGGNASKEQGHSQIKDFKALIVRVKINAGSIMNAPLVFFITTAAFMSGTRLIPVQSRTTPQIAG